MNDMPGRLQCLSATGCKGAVAQLHSGKWQHSKSRGRGTEGEGGNWATCGPTPARNRLRRWLQLIFDLVIVCGCRVLMVHVISGVATRSWDSDLKLSLELLQLPLGCGLCGAVACYC